MNRVEILDVLSRLKATYPNAYRGMRKTDAEEVVSVWQDEFSSDNAELVMEAVQGFISTNVSGFPPSPGQIRALVKRPRTCVSVPEEWADLQHKHKVLKEKRRTAGLPATLEEARAEEARADGLTAAEWNAVLDQAGLSVGVIL